jgi:hypothetical protein
MHTGWNMIKDWNRKEIEQEIWKIKWAATDPRMDGFTLGVANRT